jgi:type I restriction enzyme S subunit
MDINKSNWIDWSRVPYVPVSGVEHMRYKLNRGDIVIARMADPGKSAIIDEDGTEAAFASYLVRFVAPTIEDAYFLYGHLKSKAFRDFSEGTSTGSVQKNMNAQVIGSADVPWPSSSLRQEFAGVIMPLRSKIVQKVSENQTLSELRDALLPELLSGRLRVKDAESMMENV